MIPAWSPIASPPPREFHVPSVSLPCVDVAFATHSGCPRRSRLSFGRFVSQVRTHGSSASLVHSRALSHCATGLPSHVAGVARTCASLPSLWCSRSAFACESAVGPWWVMGTAVVSYGAETSGTAGLGASPCKPC